MQSNHDGNKGFDLDGLLDRFNAQNSYKDGDPIPAPGTEDNPWIGFEQVVRGKKTFHAYSGSERRRLNRIVARDAKNEQERGERKYNRDQRKQAFDAGTIRQQLRILKGEIEVTPDMKRNLESHIMRQTRLNEAEAANPDRRQHAEKRRSERLHDRRVARKDAGKATKRDLVILGVLS